MCVIMVKFLQCAVSFCINISQVSCIGALATSIPRVVYSGLNIQCVGMQDRLTLSPIRGVIQLVCCVNIET